MILYTYMYGYGRSGMHDYGIGIVQGMMLIKKKNVFFCFRLRLSITRNEIDTTHYMLVMLLYVTYHDFNLIWQCLRLYAYAAAQISKTRTALLSVWNDTTWAESQSGLKIVTSKFSSSLYGKRCGGYKTCSAQQEVGVDNLTAYWTPQRYFTSSNCDLFSQ